MYNHARVDIASMYIHVQPHSIISLLLWQMVVGDQLTCKNVRSSKRWRQPEVNVQDRLSWAKEVPGNEHVHTHVHVHVHVHLSKMYTHAHTL